MYLGRQGRQAGDTGTHGMEVLGLFGVLLAGRHVSRWDGMDPKMVLNGP